MGLVDEFMDEYKYWAETNEERRRRVRRLAFYRQQLHDYLTERFRRNNHKVTDREKYIQLVRESDASGIYQIE